MSKRKIDKRNLPEPRYIHVSKPLFFDPVTRMFQKQPGLGKTYRKDS